MTWDGSQVAERDSRVGPVGGSSCQRAAAIQHAVSLTPPTNQKRCDPRAVCCAANLD